MHNSFDQIYSHLKQFESDLSKSQSEVYQLKNEIEKYKTLFLQEKKESTLISEKLKNLEASSQQEKTSYLQEIDRLRKKEAELKDQSKLFSQSLFEVRKSLNHAQEHFQKQKDLYEEQNKKLKLNQLVDQNKLKEAHEIIAKYKESQDKILSDLRRSDAQAKKVAELEKKCDALVYEKNKAENLYQRRSTDLNAIQLELSKAALRNQQLTDELNKYSHISDRSKKQEVEWKELCKKLKKEIYSLNETIRKKELEAEQLKTSLHHHEITQFDEIRVIDTFDNEISEKTDEANSIQTKNSMATPPPMSQAKLLYHQKNEKHARTQLWDKKREIVRMELKIREFPEGHPQKLRLVDELLRMKQEREKLQRNLNEISKKLVQSAPSSGEFTLKSTASP